MLDRFGQGDKLATGEDYYACPCCSELHPRSAVGGLLTEEHVPPKRLGGRSLLLTCATCNSSSGANFDIHAVLRSDADDFVRGRVNGRVLPATFYADGIPLRGTAQWTDEGLQLFGVPEKNNPKEQAAHFEKLDAYMESGNPNPPLSFTVHTTYDEARARISWIRSAYLAAFAALGWSYIYRDVMAPYRNQLKQPDAEIVPTSSYATPALRPPKNGCYW